MKSLTKLYFLIGILSITCYNNLDCQSFLCQSNDLLVGCPDPDDPDDYLFDTDMNETYKIRITFMEGSQGLVSINECEQVVDILNNSFGLSSGISFVWDRNIDVYNLSNDDLFHAININVNSTPFGGGAAISIPGTLLTISKDLLFSPVIVHEMGHCLGLLHVHNHSIDDSDGKSLTPTCEEYVNPTDPNNCLECGDCICQTNAISNRQENASLDLNGDCVYNNTDSDSMSDVYQPNYNTWNNYMSYS